VTVSTLTRQPAAFRGRRTRSSQALVNVTLPSKHAAPAAPAPEKANVPVRIKASKLEAIEERLLADAIENHPISDEALDGALADIAALSAELRHSRSRPLLLRSTTNLDRIEDLLLEAVVRTHPNRERALDRLLDEVTLGDDTVALLAEEEARAEFDMQIDRDFDGLS
jgi:hypothetical protein